jgi:hypothetical protein
LDGISAADLFSPKIILLSGIGMGIKVVFSITKMRLLNTSFSNAVLQVLYGQSSKYHLTFILHAVLPISLGIGFTVLIIGLER